MRKTIDLDMLEKFINKQVALYIYPDRVALKELLRELADRKIKWQSGCFADVFMPRQDARFPYLYWNDDGRLCLYSKAGIRDKSIEPVDISRMFTTMPCVDPSDILNLL